MVDSISGVNYNGYKNDLLAKYNNNVPENLNAQTPETKPDSVSFTGKHDYDEESHTEKDTGHKSHTAGYLVTTALLIGAFFTGKYFNKIKNAVSPKTVSETVTSTKDAVTKAADNVVETVKKGAGKAKDKLTKAKNRVAERIQSSRKNIKNTSNSGAREAITNEKEANAVANINTQHVNSNTRKAVDKAKADVVTPQQQAAYDAEIAYQPMNKKREAVKANLERNNAAQRAELNSIENNSTGAENLKPVRKKAEDAEKLAQQVVDGAHVHPKNKNIYYTKDGQVTRIITTKPNSKGEYEITDPVKIAKHLAKQNVKLNSFV